MKRKMLFTFAILSVCVGNCAYPTLERANELFAPDIMTSTNVIMSGNLLYEDFDNALSDPASIVERCSMESFLLSTITSIYVRVSTNDVNDGVCPDILRDRGIFYLNMARSFKCFPTNASECVALATYVGGLHTVDYPTDKVNKHGFVSYPFCSAEELNLINSRLLDFYQNKDSQLNFYRANESVLVFKKRLLEICGIAVVGCQKTLPTTDFIAFTNQLVTVLGANEEERRVLFSTPPNR